jgi:hypothetical protein
MNNRERAIGYLKESTLSLSSDATFEQIAIIASAVFNDKITAKEVKKAKMPSERPYNELDEVERTLLDRIRKSN